MDVNSISSISAYNYQSSLSKSSAKTTTTDTTSEDQDTAVVYESSSTDRSALIAQLKADAESQVNQLKNMALEMMGNQLSSFSIANSDDDSIWQFLASGNYTVSEAAKAQAQEAISEGGYWSVDNTASRIVEFAKALTGGDSSQAESMREAFEEGFAQATKSWGKDLPSISSDTYDAVESLFDEWVNGTESSEE